jgi:hypothetical protein
MDDRDPRINNLADPAFLAAQLQQAGRKKTALLSQRGFF